ncbi:MAG: hypothetical protein DWQ08_10095, partial [Proteobacteria bacterium]
APMQGTAADLIKMAMIGVDRWMADSSPEVRIILQVHDELVLELPEGKADSVIDAVKPLMTGVAELAVPLEVEAGIGENWALAH